MLIIASQITAHRSALAVALRSSNRAAGLTKSKHYSLACTQLSRSPGLSIECRHDNDHANIVDISIAPTQQEVLCQTTPYLPANHPGTVMHLETDSQEAHRDLHFRSGCANLHHYIFAYILMHSHDSKHPSALNQADCR